MRVALFTDGIYPFVVGGMQIHSTLFARNLAQNGKEVDLYYPTPNVSGEERLPFSVEELKKIKIIEIDWPRIISFPGHYLLESYIYSRRVRTVYLSREPVDLIYIQGFSGWETLRCKKDVDTPTILNFHGYEMFQKMPNWRTWFSLQFFKFPIKWHMRKADFIISLGGKLDEIIDSYGMREKRVNLPIAVENSWLVSEINESNKLLKFLFVGRYERRKGIEEINQAISNLKSDTSFEFHFVGDIPKSVRLDDPSAIYYGPITDQDRLQEIYDSCDVLLCPSFSEGMPTVILEAMSRGLIIIATDVGAVSEMVTSENGILIQAGDSHQISEAIYTLRDKEAGYLRAMKSRSVEIIQKRFTWDVVIQKSLSQFQRIIDIPVEQA